MIYMSLKRSLSVKCPFFCDLLKNAPKKFLDPERDLATPQKWVPQNWQKMAKNGRFLGDFSKFRKNEALYVNFVQ